MKSWPKDKLKYAKFDELASPLAEATKYYYDLTPKNRDKNFKYKGYNIGDNELVTSLNPSEQLKVKNIKFSEEDQGREALEIIIGIALQLGIEQGRRVERKDSLLNNRIKDIEISALKMNLRKSEEKVKSMMTLSEGY